MPPWGPRVSLDGAVRGPLDAEVEAAVQERRREDGAAVGIRPGHLRLGPLLPQDHAAVRHRPRGLHQTVSHRPAQRCLDPQVQPAVGHGGGHGIAASPIGGDGLCGRPLLPQHDPPVRPGPLESRETARHLGGRREDQHKVGDERRRGDGQGNGGLPGRRGVQHEQSGTLRRGLPADRGRCRRDA